METYYSSSSTTRAAQASESSLHTVRKPPAKPWNKKPVVQAPPPNRPKVYKVDPVDFRDLVQKLTGASAPLQFPQPQPHQPQRLRSLAPAPLKTETDLSGSPLQLFPPPSESSGTTSPLGFDFLSPSTFNWCSFLSPGSLCGLEKSTVS